MWLCWRCEVDWHAPPGWPGSPGGAGEDRHPEWRRGGHVEGPPGLHLHAPRPGTPAGHRCARCGRIPRGEHRRLQFWDCPHHNQTAVMIVTKTPDSLEQNTVLVLQYWCSINNRKTLVQKWERNKNRPSCRNKFRLRAGERGSWNVDWTQMVSGCGGGFCTVMHFWQLNLQKNKEVPVELLSVHQQKVSVWGIHRGQGFLNMKTQLTLWINDKQHCLSFSKTVRPTGDGLMNWHHSSPITGWATFSLPIWIEKLWALDLKTQLKHWQRKFFIVSCQRYNFTVSRTDSQKHFEKCIKWNLIVLCCSSS